MRLIEIAPDVLINPDKIISVEKARRGNKVVVVINAENKEYVLETPFEKFLLDLKNIDINPIEGWFAG